MTTLTLPRVESTTDRRAARSQLRRTIVYRLPLTVIIAAQAAYTVRLMPIGYTSTDEARYIYAGHVLIHELFHGGGSPYYETYFSGAPVFYSPLAAIADHLGGVTAVRMMSMLFMLTATVLLFLTARRLFGYASALCSAGIFAGLGMTQVVGRNAIYDSLAFVLTTLAAYFAVRARERHGTKWLLLIPVTLLLAYYAKYVTILFDPVVIGLASLGVGNWREACRRVFALGVTTAAALTLSVFLAGSAYLKGMLFTVFSRQHGSAQIVLLAAVPASRREILFAAWSWFGLVIVFGAIATAIAMVVRRRRKDVLILCLCVLAGLLVTAESLHLGSMESSRRHDDLGMWFASIPAGYAASALLAIRSWVWRALGTVVAVLAVSVIWVHYSQPPGTFLRQVGYDNGTDSNAAIYGVLNAYLRVNNGRYLLSGNNNINLIYMDHISINWWQVVDDNYIAYPIPGRGGNWSGSIRGLICARVLPGCRYLTGSAGFVEAIKAHDFDVISLTRNPLLEPQDTIIERTVESTPGYALLTTAGGGPTWIYLPDYEHRG